MKKLPPAAMFIVLLLLANAGLSMAATRPAGAVLLALVLPGWGWTQWLFPRQGWPGRLALSTGLSFAIASLGTILLHYLPGPIAAWHMLVLLNAAAIAPFLHPIPRPRPTLSAAAIGFGLVMLAAVWLRIAGLGYSEFQGDEALAMISAAEAIEGHADALFLRGKGPGEILLPAAVWTLSGTITEGLARVPFALAGVMGLLSLYLLARDLFNAKTARYATAILAASGFMVGFSRIVQYQTVVVWMSILSLWTFWQWRVHRGGRWLAVSGMFLGIGLLAHYDAIFVVPAIGWLWLAGSRTDPARHLKAGFGWAMAATATAATFYAPYLLDPQISRTGDYVSGRIGAGLKNNLADFLHFHAFYSSFYHLLIAGLLLAGFIGWAMARHRSGKIGAIAAVAVLLLVAAFPNAPGAWAVLPFAIVLLAAFAAPGLGAPHRAALVWFAGPFLGYNFAVATPLTHIYTTLPGWALLAGWAAAQVKINRRAAWAVNGGLVLLSTLYLWNAFVRHDVEFLQDYPAGNLPVFVSPYPGPPPTGFFGFVHKSGWKAIAPLLADTPGDYDSNEEADITSWYTRHAPRACDPGAEWLFVADDLIDAQPLDAPAEGYAPVGRVDLPNGKGLSILQRRPATASPGELDATALAQQFDQTATPAAFAREARPATAADVNFGGQVRLVGYTLIDGRAYPGGRLLLTLYWQAAHSLPESYKVFVHLDSDKKYAQADSVPVCGRFPTTDWRPGQIIADQHALEISPDTPPGEHPLVIGLYQPDTGARLDVLDVAGNPAGVSATIATVKISAGP